METVSAINEPVPEISETVPEESKISSRKIFNALQSAVRGVGKAGGYVYDAVSNSIYYTGRCSGHILSGCKHLKVAAYEKMCKKQGITIQRLVRNEAAIDDDAKRDFYVSLGRDIVELTKSGMESKNLTIIDLSKYKL